MEKTPSFSLGGPMKSCLQTTFLSIEVNGPGFRAVISLHLCLLGLLHPSWSLASTGQRMASEGSQKWTSGSEQKKTNNFPTWCLSNKRPPESFNVNSWKYFLKHHRVMGEKRFRMTESLVPTPSIKFQFSPLHYLWPFSLCNMINILNPELVFSDPWPLTGVLAHFLRVMFDLGMLLSFLSFPCYSLKPGTPAHNTLTLLDPPCATQEALLNVLSELGKHLERDSILTSWEIKMQTIVLFHFFNLRMNFWVISFFFLNLWVSPFWY